VAVPQRVPIAREAGYHTDTIGHYRDGQFYAAVHGAHRDDDRAPDRGRERVRWYAFLHLFDAGGNHRRSEISLIGVAPRLSGALGEQATARLASLLGGLEDATFGDITIRPFTVTYDGVTFGLIDESGPDRTAAAGPSSTPTGSGSPALGWHLQHLMTAARSRICQRGQPGGAVAEPLRAQHRLPVGRPGSGRLRPGPARAGRRRRAGLPP
jgi:hypothetical protein